MANDDTNARLTEQPCKITASARALVTSIVVDDKGPDKSDTLLESVKRE